MMSIIELTGNDGGDDGGAHGWFWCLEEVTQMISTNSSMNDTQRALPCRRSREEDLNGRGEPAEMKRRRGRKRRVRRSCDARGGKEEDERGAAAQR